MAVVESPPAADPAPLGLAGFALTTFLLSGHNASFIPDLIWVAPAIFYGGLATVAVTLLWFYLSSLSFVIGAEVNAQLEGVGASRPSLAL